MGSATGDTGVSSEALNQQQARALHHTLAPGSQNWRNNSGAFQDDKGRWIRYGLANDSKKLNSEIKSSDLIGITPTIIEPWMVGYSLGVFTAMEIKEPGWHLTPGDKRGQAQSRFHDLVRQACGFAGFVTDPAQDVPRIIKPWG